MVNNMTDLTAQEPAWQTRDHLDDPVIGELRNRFGPDAFTVQATRTGVPVVWIKREQLLEVGDFLKKLPKPYVMLFDLHGMDERLRTHREGLPAADFSVFYHLISIDRNRDIMLKVALAENDLHVPTFTKLFPNANWYERETWDLFGITFDGHPNLRRIMMPQTWKGHPLRKDYPARATEFSPFELTKAKQDLEMEALTFKPEEWGMKRGTENEDFMFLNLGPNHPSAHGAFRIVLQLDGEEIVDCVPDIGYHHRGAEKMGERQSWHSYIPYTDRIEYLGGCVNEMPYVLAVEKLAGITVPDRVNVIRVMLSELFRINSHLLYISTFIQDVGAMTPVFFAFTDRQKIYDLVEAITGFRMHPAWFRIGGVAHDLPRGWDRLLREFKVEANVGKPQVSYKETVRRAATVDTRYSRQTGGKGQFAHVKLTIEPNEPGKGYEFINKVTGGAIPKEFIPCVDQGIQGAMLSGVLAGYQVVDIKATLLDGSFHEVDSSEMAFKICGSMAFKEACQKADPVLLEPIMKVVVTAPDDYMGDVMGDINARRGQIVGTDIRNGTAMIESNVPLSTMFGYATDLRSKTQGRATYSMEPSHFVELPKSLQEALVNSRQGSNK